MLRRIYYSVQYRLGKLNTRLIKGSNNQINIHGKIFGCHIQIEGSSNKIDISEGSIIQKTNIIIKGNNCHLYIAENIIIKGGDLWLENNKCVLSIEKNTTIEEAHIAVTEDESEIIIGEDCMFAKGIEIRNGDSHAIYNSQNERLNPAQNVRIEKHVWLGSRVIILKGVHIGEGAIVSAGSIVTKNVPKNSIVAGIPASITKENIYWTRERKETQRK